MDTQGGRNVSVGISNESCAVAGWEELTVGQQVEGLQRQGGEVMARYRGQVE